MGTINSQRRLSQDPTHRRVSVLMDRVPSREGKSRVSVVGAAVNHMQASSSNSNAVIRTESSSNSEGSCGSSLVTAFTEEPALAAVSLVED